LGTAHFLLKVIVAAIFKVVKVFNDLNDLNDLENLFKVTNYNKTTN
jgi:hypothetical protein